MRKFIPYKKLSKKKRREINAAKRSVWMRSPVTRITPNKKHYDRAAEKTRLEE